MPLFSDFGQVSSIVFDNERKDTAVIRFNSTVSEGEGFLEQVKEKLQNTQFGERTLLIEPFQSESLLFIGNLTPNIDDNALIQMFEKHGHIERAFDNVCTKRIMNKTFAIQVLFNAAGRSKCYGFVEYGLKSQETLDTVHNSGINLRKFCHKRRHQGVLAISDAAIIALCRMAPMLEELQLVDKLGANQFRELTDIGLLALSEKSSTLHTLKLKLASPEYAVLCSEVAIMKLMCSCKNATQIELSNFKCLSDPPVYELVQNRFVLKDLTLEGTMITDVAIELIASCAKNLNSISVKGCRKLTEDGLKSLGQCRTLKSINVGHTYCLTDAAATDICLGNPFLKILVFSYGLISDSALKSISTCSHLEELALNNCFRVTNSGLKLIANGCLQLRYISVSYCERLSDSGIIALGNGCPRLQKVRLDGCRRLSNPCISVLSKNNIKLRHLSMQNCPKLSNTVFEYLLDAPAIRFISLGRAKLTQSGIEYYHLKKPLVELFIDGKRFSSYSTG